MNLPPRATWSALFCAAVASLSCGEEPVTIAAETPVVEAPAPAPQAQRPAAAPDLLARRELALGARPLSVLAQDFDGDGFDDLAVAGEKPGRPILFPGSRPGPGAESGTP
ncbi:MAG: FG-GAP repeat protein, partial [Planctomycetes bacterium]|nr:FG-GAP repeat protein [Planctomycetota bacterium]